jgi:hypothetical protein
MDSSQQNDFNGFEYPYSPKNWELLAWAAIEDDERAIDYLPMEWEVCVNWNDRELELANLAINDNLPQAKEFLHCLYCHMGTIADRDRKRFETVLAQLVDFQDPMIQKLVRRCYDLVEGNLAYNYTDWCEAGFMQRDKLHDSEADRIS